jgi:hypothetical protein
VKKQPPPAPILVSAGRAITTNVFTVVADERRVGSFTQLCACRQC